jgi:hypothetical protein
LKAATVYLHIIKINKSLKKKKKKKKKKSVYLIDLQIWSRWFKNGHHHTGEAENPRAVQSMSLDASVILT